MAKNDIRDWHGSGFVTDRGATPRPLNRGYLSAGAEGPKRLQPKKRKPVKVSKPKYKKGLKDKYGRLITREEYERREKFRERRKKMTAAQAERATKIEMERRRKWREKAEKRLGSGVKRVTRNKDMAKGTSSRYVNRKTEKQVPAKAQSTRDKYKKRK